MHQSDQTFKKTLFSQKMRDPDKLILLAVPARVVRQDPLDHLVVQETLDPQETPERPEFRAILVHLVPNRTFSPSLSSFRHLQVEKKDPRQIHFPTCKHKLDLLDPEDLLVCKDHPVLKDSKVPWEKVAILDHLGPQVLQDLEVFPACLAKMVKMEETEKVDPKDPLVHQENEVCRECPVYLDLRDTEVFLA